MKKILSLVAFLFLLSVTMPVAAQGVIHLSSVEVNIWPEYDQPAVLVINRIVLASDTSLPATINLRIPAQAEIYAVAVSDPTKGLLNTPYDRVIEGSQAILTITASTTEIQVEYYDSLIKNGNSRHVVFTWMGDYSVETFSIILQQPAGATDMQTNPPMTNNGTGPDGFTYYQSTIQSLPINQPFNLTVDYQKSTDSLSITGLPVTPAQSIDSGTSGRISGTNVLPIVLAVLGGALIAIAVVGGIYFWRSGRHQFRPSRKRHVLPASKDEASNIYCPQCGKRAQPEDAFCRTCGTRLHKDVT